MANIQSSKTVDINSIASGKKSFYDKNFETESDQLKNKTTSNAVSTFLAKTF